MTVTAGTAESMQLGLQLTITNSSQIEIEMDTVRLLLLFEECAIGHVVLPNFALRIGNNDLEVDAFFAPDPTNEEHIAAGLRMLTQYLTGRVSHVRLSGFHPQVTSIAFMRPALQALHTQIPIMGIDRPMILGSTMLLSMGSVLRNLRSGLTVQSRMKLQNPLDCEVRILKLNGSVEYSGKTLSTMSSDFTTDPIMLPPRAILEPKQMVTQVIASFASSTMQKLMSSGISVSVDCVLHVQVGEYTIQDLIYSQDDIPVGMGT